ncbi:MAG: hypothetical protein HY401_05515, partial [Elusimicrobia bacterium]|nr:hypothetical protein [Elusimicrobiota bacterium]
MKQGYLILEDGSYFPGRLFGAVNTLSTQHSALSTCSLGEVVFNTAMCGYEEVLTDPSYRGQIVAMTYPHQGNYGITLCDNESSKVHVAGFVVGELSELPSNWRAKMSLSDYLKDQGVVGIAGVDTRALTLRLRSSGAMRAAIVNLGVRGQGSGVSEAMKTIVEEIKKHPAMEGLALAEEVSVSQKTVWKNGSLAPSPLTPHPSP